MKNLNLERKVINSKGITLLALVVTIIILLVLAGITIASLTGDNGLIGKTGEAKKQTEISEGLEQLEIAVTQSTNKRGNIDETKLAKNLSEINGLKYINTENEEIDITENTEIKLTAKVKLKGNIFKINDEGKVSYKREGIFDNEDIMEAPSTYYGKYVTNYNSPNDAGIQDAQEQLGKWQIFLADDENIYLIASNYISRYYTSEKKLPNETNDEAKGFNYDTSSTDLKKVYPMWFFDIANKYQSSDISSLLSKFNERTKNNYHTWMNMQENQSKNYVSVRAVCSMIDIELWNGYKNDIYSDYAIGGPTLEMFCKSYNNTHTGDELLANRTSYGYKLTKGDNKEVSSISGLKSNAINDTIDSMYFKYYWNKTPQYYWISSIGTNNWSGNQGYVTNITKDGQITSTNYNTNGIGFRPIVCLKQNIHLVKNSDGLTYSIELD